MHYQICKCIIVNTPYNKRQNDIRGLDYVEIMVISMIL